MSSELRLVDRIIKEVRGFFEHHGVKDESNLKLILREMLNNAVEHGNKSQENKTVTCKISRLEGKRFRIDVQDEGEGFEYKNLDPRLPEDPKQIRNRGFSLIDTFSDEIVFNKPGNKITVYVTITDEVVFDSHEENGTVVITPSGSLTASIADQFREFLQKLHEAGTDHFRFDFKQVEDIDSVCLSVLIVLSKTVTREDRNHQLEIVNANKDLVMLFKLTRMDELYTIII